MTCPIGTDVARAAAIVAAGGLIAFPTETVYGLGANALDPRAVARIFEVKERPLFDPLIVHLADRTWLPRVVASFPEAARRLADQFWPGPLTVVLPKQAIVPDLVTAGLSTVGVRIPAHVMALEFMRRADVPVAAPSANLFGRVSPTTAGHVAEQLGDRIDYILDGGACAIGLESTVLDFSGDMPVLLRPGGLSLERIQEVIGPISLVDPSSAHSSTKLTEARRAPGMLARHYAPRTRLSVVAAGAAIPDGDRIGLLTFGQEQPLQRFAVVENLSPRGDLAEAAVNLFAAIRRLDAQQLDAIIARPVPEIGLGRAINNRLQRASRH